MTEHYDVVIAGAGPAGGQCARDLAARNYDVLLLEAEGEAEFPAGSNKSTAGTFPSTMSSFGIPDEVVMNYTDEVVLESPNDHFVRDQTGAVLEFAEYKQWLVADARDDGADVRFDARATAPIRDDGKAVGVRYNGDEEVLADVVIDATGPAAPLARKLDVCDLKRERQAIGVEYELRGIDVDHPEYADLTDAMMLRLDHDLAPGGYSWVFHTGGSEAKVGVCYIQNESHRQNARDDFRIDDYLEYWMETDPRFEDAERIEGKQHRGSAHIQMPDTLSTGGFMAIGDTVPTVDPLWGEGIDKCMRSGRMAAATADSALTGEPDTSAEMMSVYDDLWHSEVAPNMRTRLLMTELLYRGSNERYDKLMADLRRLGHDTLQRANSGSLRAIASLLTFDDVPLVAGLARDLVQDSIPGLSRS
ncbi:digeranylgeranylglycerophospholipid reductase [Halobaculum sp. MBLA0147]|uniref:digeranylgeranylglycerophospholipid reductase n=1 Tax=Halobaculum sp. MBLA0147 TaxID=3079934 RepID=UPI00352638DA